jgi:hypothetical protein
MKNIYQILIILLTCSCTHAQKNELHYNNSISMGVSFLFLPSSYSNSPVYGENKPLYGWEVSYQKALSTHNCIGINLLYTSQTGDFHKYAVFSLQAEYRRYFGTKALMGLYLALNYSQH